MNLGSYEIVRACGETECKVCIASEERFHSDYQAQKKTIINLLAKQLKLSEIQINLINRVASAWVILASLRTGATNTQYLI